MRDKLWQINSEYKLMWTRVPFGLRFMVHARGRERGRKNKMRSMISSSAS